jgi:CBS domain-containing protein
LGAQSRGVDAVAIVDADGYPVGIVTGSDLVALPTT